MNDTAYVIDFEHGLTCAKLECLAPGQKAQVKLRPEGASAVFSVDGTAQRSDDGDEVFITVEVGGLTDKHKWNWSNLSDRLSARRR